MLFSALLRTLAFGFAFALACHSPAYAATQAAGDSDLFTYYRMVGDTAITWTTCGHVGNSSGCYGSGFLSPLAGPCAIMETRGSTSGNTVSRYVYLVEASSTGFKNAVLDVYLKQDVISGSDTPSMSLVHRIDLGLKVGLKTACFMAAGPRYLFIGTALSVRAARYDKVTGKVVPEGTSSSATGLVSQITADERGYVTVSYKYGSTTLSEIYDPNGDAAQGSALSYFMPNASVGVKPQ